MINNPLGIMSDASKLSVQQLQQAIKDGTVPPYIGIPLIQEKIKQQQMMQPVNPQALSAPTVEQQVMQQARSAEDYARGGIVALAEGGDVGQQELPETETENWRSEQLKAYRDKLKSYRALQKVTPKEATPIEPYGFQQDLHDPYGIDPSRRLTVTKQVPSLMELQQQAKAKSGLNVRVPENEVIRVPKGGFKGQYLEPINSPLNSLNQADLFGYSNVKPEDYQKIKSSTPIEEPILSGNAPSAQSSLFDINAMGDQAQIPTEAVVEPNKPLGQRFIPSKEALEWQEKKRYLESPSQTTPLREATTAEKGPEAGKSIKANSIKGLASLGKFGKVLGTGLALAAPYSNVYAASELAGSPAKFLAGMVTGKPDVESLPSIVQESLRKGPTTAGLGVLSKVPSAPPAVSAPVAQSGANKEPSFLQDTWDKVKAWEDAHDSDTIPQETQDLAPATPVTPTAKAPDSEAPIAFGGNKQVRIATPGAVALGAPAITSVPTPAGATMEAQKAPQAPQGPSDKTMQDYFKQYDEALGENKGIKSLADQILASEAENEKDKKRAPWLALMKAGLASMAGTSPNALVNLGQGAQVGLDAYGESTKEFKNAHTKHMQMLAELEQTRRNEQIARFTYGANSVAADNAARAKEAALDKELAARRELEQLKIEGNLRVQGMHNAAILQAQSMRAANATGENRVNASYINGMRQRYMQESAALEKYEEQNSPEQLATNPRYINIKAEVEELGKRLNEFDIPNFKAPSLNTSGAQKTPLGNNYVISE